MKAPDWVFFDLDNTLWDFDGNAEKALEVLFQRHHLHLKSNHTAAEFIEMYKAINAGYWQLYENGEVTKDILRTARFTDTFIQMGIPPDEHPEKVWEEYLSICPHITGMIPGAMELLELCARNAGVGLITNGFEETQKIKIRETGIEKHIKFMITSEDAGVAKPDPRIFQRAVEVSGALTENVLYIGDTFKTDVLGALNASVPVIWFNPEGVAFDPRLSENPLFVSQFENHTELIGYLKNSFAWV